MRTTKVGWEKKKRRKTKLKNQQNTKTVVYKGNLMHALELNELKVE